MVSHVENSCFPSAAPGPYDLTMEKRARIAQRLLDAKYYLAPGEKLASVNKKAMKKIPKAILAARILVSVKQYVTRNMPFAVQAIS